MTSRFFARRMGVVISALIVTHPPRELLKDILTRIAAGIRAASFDEADAVCFVRDAYDNGIAMYLSIIDGTDKALAEMADERASNDPAAQDGADAA